MAPINTTRDNFIVSLKEYATVPKVIEERIDRWLNIEGIKPKRKDTSFAFTFRIKIFHFKFLFFSDRIETWVGIEKIGDEGKIEFRVSSYERRWGEKLATIKSVGVLKNLLGSLEEVAGLEGAAAANVWSQLIK